MSPDEIVETATENVIAIPLPATAVVLSLAAYGTYDLTRKAVGKVSRYRANRKAVKANNPETPTSQS